MKAAIRIIGDNIVVKEEGGDQIYNKSMLIEFESRDDAREAMLSGKCELSFMDDDSTQGGGE